MDGTAVALENGRNDAGLRQVGGNGKFASVPPNFLA